MIRDYTAMASLCDAMAVWLAGQQHWTAIPDDAVVMESRSTDGTDAFRITAGMIRRTQATRRIQQ